MISFKNLMDGHIGHLKTDLRIQAVATMTAAKMHEEEKQASLSRSMLPFKNIEDRVSTKRVPDYIRMQKLAEPAVAQAQCWNSRNST